MQRKYKAILHGDYIQWIDKPPERTHPVQVHIILLEETGAEPARERGQVMAEALAVLANRGTFSAITDPVAWQREERHDRGSRDLEP